VGKNSSKKWEEEILSVVKKAWGEMVQLLETLVAEMKAA